MNPTKKTVAPLLAGCEACGKLLSERLGVTSGTIEGEFPLSVRYSPIADLEGGGIFGHLVGVHGPHDQLWCSPARLFSIARRMGQTTEMFHQYFRSATRHFVANQGQGLLVLPLFDGPRNLGTACGDLLAAAATAAGLPIERIVVIHNGGGDLDGADLNQALAAAGSLHGHGFALAAGGMGCPRSDKMLWAHIEPQFAVIDDGLLKDFDPNLLRNSRFAEQISEAAAQGRRVMAQGVDSLALLKALQDMQFACVAGDFIGKSVAVPTRTLSAAAHKSIAEKVSGQPSSPQAGTHVLEKMLQGTPPVAPDTPAEVVFAMFEDLPELRAIAVVKDDTPLGLIARYDMVDNMARPYRHELYGRKPCMRFMDTEPMTVDLRLPLSELAEVVVRADPRHLISGFIITSAGRYLGMGSVQDLVREVTSMQMEAAKYSNPLSQLPGNVPINQHIDNLLAAREPCAIAYCDLDHFKPFNDVYGYARGDDVIRLTARILSEACDTENDFVGHIGGDDFVLVFRSGDWQARCERSLQMFGTEILGFFSRDDVERGGYVTENRKGEMEFHALTSLSIGVTEVKPGMFRSHLEVSVVAAEVKKKAKGIKGNSLYVNQRIR